MFLIGIALGTFMAIAVSFVPKGYEGLVIALLGLMAVVMYVTQYKFHFETDLEGIKSE